MNLLFIGDKPSKCTDLNKAFKGAKCEKRLYQWIQFMTKDADSYNFSLINRVDKEFEFYVLWAIEDGVPIIALGNNASKALKDIPHFKLPHPSGLNRQINNTEYIENKLKACKIYINQA